MSASTVIDWLAIGTWTATAAFQLITARRDGRKSLRRKPKREMVQRFLNGESIRGWRRIIPSLADGVRYASDTRVYMVTPAIGDQDPEGGQGGNGYSLDFVLTSRLLDGRQVRDLRRYSRLRQASTLLLEMVYSRDQWREQISCYLNSSTIATVFRKRGMTTFKVLLVNVKSRAVGQFLVEAPEEVNNAHYAYLSTAPKLQFHIIYSMRKRGDDGNRYLHLIDSSYDHPPIDSPGSSIIRPSSWESIRFPLGNRKWGFYGESIWPCMSSILVNSDARNPGSRFIWIDSKLQLHIDTWAAWQWSLKTTTRGASIFNAMRGTVAFESEIFRDPPFDGCQPWMLLLAKCEILTGEYRPGTLQRRLAPVSLKLSAAEVACKANPDTKMSAIKEATGIDVSDGIVEDGDGDGDCRVIYL